MDSVFIFFIDRIYRINMILLLSLFPEGREKTQSGSAGEKRLDGDSADSNVVW